MSDDDNPNQLIQFAATTAKVARAGEGVGLQCVRSGFKRVK
jgi:hypothetical protein